MRGYEKRQKDVLFSECILEYAVQLIIKSTATVSGYPPRPSGRFIGILPIALSYTLSLAELMISFCDLAHQFRNIIILGLPF
jgi:hypothetical protein